MSDWEAVCPIEEIVHERGVTALVHGQAVAIFRTRDDRPFVASPVHRHDFDLATGVCLDDEQVSVPAYDVRVEDGVVQVGGRR